jgi:hypothetical protein
MRTAIVVGLVALSAAGCGREVGSVVLAGREPADVGLAGLRKGSVRFRVDVELQKPTSETVMTDWWDLELEVVRGGAVIQRAKCDALDIGFGSYSSERCVGFCTSKYVGDRLIGCTLDVPGGDATLRARLVPRPSNPIEIKRMTLHVVQ